MGKDSKSAPAGFSIHNYFKLVSELFLPSIKAKKMIDYTNQHVLIYGLLVTKRYNTTSQNKLMRLSTFVDSDGNYFDAVYFTDVVHLYPINGIGIYGCYGKITNRYGFCSMNVIQSKKMGIVCDPRS